MLTQQFKLSPLMQAQFDKRNFNTVDFIHDGVLSALHKSEQVYTDDTSIVFVNSKKQQTAATLKVNKTGNIIAICFNNCTEAQLAYLQKILSSFLK